MRVERGGVAIASWVDLSPSVNRKYSGPMNTSVNSTITRVSTIRYVIFPRRRFSATLEISVRVDVVLAALVHLGSGADGGGGSH